MSGGRHYYLTLDAMRGVAALVVAASHVSFMAQGWTSFPHAYLAVDFFFILSGFVIGAAYEGRLRGSMGPMEFFARRVIRLWPLFFLGFAVAFAYLALRAAHGLGDLKERAVVLAALDETFMAPTPDGAAWGHLLYPINFPAWSLLFELGANMALALAVRWLTTPRLCAVIVMGAAAVALTAVLDGNLDAGSHWATAGGGLARVAFGFPFGLLLARILREPPKSSNLIPAIGCALLAGALTLGPETWGDDLSVALIAAPLLVVLGSRFDPGGILSAPAAWLGRTSYAIYILHVPVAYWVLLACHRALGPAPHIWLVAPITLAAVAAAATLADLVWDVPIRKALSRRLMAILRRRTPSAAPA